MDSPAPVAAWVVLGVALLALAVVVAGLVLTRPHPPAEDPDTGPAEPSAAPGRPAGPHWAQDDLPGFAAAPPGTPPVPGDDDAAAAAPGPPLPAGPSLPDPAPRAVAGLTAAALALVAGLAGVSLATGDGDPDGGQDGGLDPPAATATVPAPSPPAPRPPDLPAVPADPLPGEQGAGVLATRSVPLGEDGVTARLTLDGLVLEQRAVGVSVTYATVSATVGGDGTALAHLRLPTWNCLGTTAPADPAGAGCTPTGVEYADLPTPALAVTRDGDALRLTGRFPTYTRLNGTPPAYTGRVYPLTVLVAPAAAPRDGEAPAEGALVLGTGRAGTVGDRTLSRIRVAG
ncbi:hypothetical protein JOD57_001623 [Geodermatophilus bullaregiensis]|uniref:hypothetical protein n=1 Tax=Geodermatophilus bullaregiensis TaxID=1564160 RepID=UPI0019575BC6|nr:hypothetical protein [Geodermatophilus bullaregiensis]MBM7805786.1 hypothetical protein [Geodermatophilus bullaregiensis]